MERRKDKRSFHFLLSPELMADPASTPNHLYLTDTQGRRTHVVLSLEKYEELLDKALDAQDVEIVQQRRGEGGEFVSLEEMKKRLEV